MKGKRREYLRVFLSLGDEKNFQADVRTYLLHWTLLTFSCCNDVVIIMTRNRRKGTTHKVCSIFFLMDNCVGKKKNGFLLWSMQYITGREKKNLPPLDLLFPCRYTIRSFILLFLLL